MSERKPNFIERFLFGPRVNEGIEEKGNFPFNAAMRGNQYDWSTPSPNGYSITYGTAIDYAVEVGDLVDNSAIMACMLWIMRTFPEARIRVMKRVKGGKPVEADDHPLTKLLARPNPFYSGRLLQQPSLLSFNWRGETYIRKVRNSMKQVIRLYYEPHWTCRPVRRSSEDFISNYQLWRDNKWVDVPKEDIIHIRQGLDPEDPMHGLSPLASALREVYTDNAAARYASAMMRNLGVPGMIVTPKDDDIDLETDIVKLKAGLKAITTGDNRGEPLVFDKPLDITFPQIDPQKMDTRSNRKITEERISGLLGVPAIVAGLGAGLDRSTFANMAEAREMAYESNIIPTQSLWADELNTQLLNELGNPDTEFVDWDYSTVRVLQDDENKKAQKYAVLYAGGVIKRSEARADLGYDVAPEDEQYKQSAPAPAFGLPPEEPQDALESPESAPKALMSGNGHLAGITITAGGSGYATPLPLYGEKARKVTQESVLEDILRDTKAELERIYEEVAGKV